MNRDEVLKNHIKNYLESVMMTLQKMDIESIYKMINLFIEKSSCLRTIYVFGNGGSAATALHMQNDFNNETLSIIGKKFNIVSLSNNVSLLTSIANDFSYKDVFFKQIEGRLNKHDLIIAISGSGNSKNVIKAVEYAKEQDVKIISFTGFDGGILKKISDVNIHVPIDNMQITEDLHLIVSHLFISVMSSLNLYLENK